ncbi:hypothetical protein FRX31_025423, partial [Thalictrum thalictroides]
AILGLAGLRSVHDAGAGQQGKVDDRNNYKDSSKDRESSSAAYEHLMTVAPTERAAGTGQPH